jgi:hypothetical protein
MVASKSFALAAALALLSLAACGGSDTSDPKPAAPTETTAALCRDTADNDGDTLLDCDDPDCQGYVFCAPTTELTSAACQDSLDNDGDGDVDCDDADCAGFVFCAPATELTAAACQNTADDDGDGATDCADADCAGFIFCAPATELTVDACQNGSDDDGDTLVDCDDPDCQGFIACADATTETSAGSCQDGADNDGDGTIDCADADCQGFLFCAPATELTATACQDGTDEDGDGLTDCADPDCAGFIFCAPATELTAVACQNGADDDLDTLVDCADPDCRGFIACAAATTENTSATCQDGTDNDDDGVADCADADCRGFLFCAPPVENTAPLCEDGLDNDGDAFVDCDDTDCQGLVTCVVPVEETPSLCADGLDNDGDGDVDCDDPGCWGIAACRHYSGYPVYDSWGAAWDGLQRTVATWASANAECAALGGRLPTVTELVRNNATSGSGDVGTSADTSLLWTFITGANGNPQVVRLSDGGIGNAPPAATYPFRCVWPPPASAAFEGPNCFGPAGAECVTVRRFYNMDASDRPALDMVAAMHECSFVNGSIPMVEDWTDAIHGGALTGTWNNYLWAGDVMYATSAPYVLHGIVNFDAPRAANWTFDNQANLFASWNWPYATSRFRCIGKRSATEGTDPAPPACNGGCFTMGHRVPSPTAAPGRRSPIWADVSTRPAAPRAAAAQACAGLGGTLPTLMEVQELIHAGLPFTGAEDPLWLWTSSPIYHGNYQSVLVRRWSAGYTNPRIWQASGTGSVSWDPGNNAYPYRCVWHQSREAAPVTCGLDQSPTWDGTSFGCADRTAGTDGGNANGGAFQDKWGDAWDATERAANTWSGASTVCGALGGRLPTPTELYRVRAGVADPAPNATGNWLWTLTPGFSQGMVVVERLSDGVASQSCDNGCASFNYRCIWPASRGNVFGGNVCNGDPGTAGSPLDPCFRTGHHVTDRFDRVATYPASAATECSYYGGFVGSLRTFEELIHGGAPNGDFAAYNWLTDPMFAGAFYSGLARWSGTGNFGWYWNNQLTGTAGLGGYGNLYRYRCVFNDLLR